MPTALANMMAHADGLGRKDRHVGAALAHRFELVGFNALPDRIVADFRWLYRRQARVFKTGDLGVAKVLKRRRRGGIMTVAIDNHLTGVSSAVLQGRTGPDRNQAGVDFNLQSSVC